MTTPGNGHEPNLHNNVATYAAMVHGMSQKNPILALAGDIQRVVMVAFSLNRNIRRAKEQVKTLQGRNDKFESWINETHAQTTGTRLDKLR
ncbi:MAG: hypothetical protein AB7P76_08960 [Candidatus Melainabacteria bacterium]